MIRPASQRPTWHQVLRRTVVVTVLTAFALWLLAAASAVTVGQRLVEVHRQATGGSVDPAAS